MTAVGRYQILERLGQGAMGVVYKALDPTIGRTVAIKAIRLSDFQNEEEQRRVHERLLREAQSAGLLSHPNIVTIYDVLEVANSAYIVMEYVDGDSLEHMLRNHTLPDRMVLLHCLRQVADALDYAHRKGIVHRDIKPANIILADVGQGTDKLAKVTDFGIAKFISQDVTYSGLMVGTPAYMSPEQIQGFPLNGKSDQFSLAVVVYEFLTGAKPFTAESLPTLFYQICKADPKPVEALDSRLSGEVGAVVARALAKEPDMRFEDCRAFVAALSPALEQSPDWTLGNEEAQALLAIAAVAPAPAPPPSATVLDETMSQSTMYPLPTLTRRRVTPEEESPLQRRSWLAGKLLALLLLGLAVVMAVIFIVRWNPGTSVPRRTTKAKTSPRTPPPPTAYPQEDVPAQNNEHANNRKKAPEVAKSAPVVPALASDVEFLSEPPNAKITVDDHADVTCQSPCTLPLSSGRHTLTAELEGFNLERRIFAVPSEKPIDIVFSKSIGFLTVTSEPNESQVFVDGKEYGQTPITLRLPAGSHQILLVNGSQQREETIIITADSFATHNVRW